jgi:site-specific DNA-adenine methylase
MNVKPPFPYFGGKSKVAPLVWRRFGAVTNYVEPFCGSAAMLLNRPEPQGVETVNDADGYLSNFWRATQHDPEAVARWADNPVNENDLHAVHSWLVANKEDFLARLEGDPEYFDAKVAGWWCWGACCWIGSGWCSGDGPWAATEGEDGAKRLTNVGAGGIRRKRPHLGTAGQGVKRQRPHLGNAGQGVNRQLPHLGNAGRGVNRQLPHLGNAGRGVNRQLPHLGNAGRGERLADYFGLIRDRIKNVRVCCGDWTRVCGDTPLFPVGRGKGGSVTAVFLDPPYADTAGRDADLYRKEDLTIAHAVREWALSKEDDTRIRIALCGYEGEHIMPNSWDCVEWKAAGGYGGQSKDHDNPNARKERIWFSPSCVSPRRNASKQANLFLDP